MVNLLTADIYWCNLVVLPVFMKLFFVMTYVPHICICSLVHLIMKNRLASTNFIIAFQPDLSSLDFDVGDALVNNERALTEHIPQNLIKVMHNGIDYTRAIPSAANYNTLGHKERLPR